MAAAGNTPIQLYYSNTAGNAPAAANLISGELALNMADGVLYYKDSTNTVSVLASRTKANAALSNTGSVITVNGVSQLFVSNTASSTSNSTGALVVQGGIGTSGAIYSTGGSITINNGLATTGNSGTIFLGDGAFTKTLGSGWTFPGSGVTSGSFYATGTGFQGQLGSNTQTSYGVSGIAGTGIYFPTTGFIALAANAANALFISSPAGAANYLQANGALSGIGPTLSAQGTDANTDIKIASKGTGSVLLFSNGATSFAALSSTGGPQVGYLKTLGSPTGGAVYTGVASSDANMSSVWFTRGNGTHNFNTNDGGTSQFTVAHTASAVNYVQVTGAATSATPTFIAQGSDTNVGIELRTKSAGQMNFTKFRDATVVNQYLFQYAGGLASDANGAAFWRGLHIGAPIYTVSAANKFPRIGQYFELQSLADPTYVNSYYSISNNNGSNIEQYFTNDTGGAFTFKNTASNSSDKSFRVVPYSTHVNYLQVAGANTANAAVLSTQGSDTNVSMALKTQGTGAIDLAAGSSGVNISNGGTVTAITRIANGSAYTSVPAMAITAPTTAGGVQAIATANMYLASFSIAGGGTGYTVNDVLTVVGGTNLDPIQLTVSAVSAGVITAVTTLTYGYYSVFPSSPVSVTGGTGSGATFNLLTWGFSGASITNAGSGYVEQPTVTFSGGGGSGAAAYATVGSGTVVKSLGSTMLFQTSGGTAFGVVDIANSVNYIRNQGAASGFQVFSAVQGADTNTSYALTSKGNGAVSFYTNLGNQLQFTVAHTASAVNYLQATGGPTTNGPTLSAQGSDTNISMNILGKGTGYLNLVSNQTNYWQLYGAGSTGTPYLYTWGSDANINAGIVTKGTGSVIFGTNGGGTTANQLLVTHTANAVNYVQVTGSNTANAVIISSQGSDANVSISLAPKSTGSVLVGQNYNQGTGILQVGGNTSIAGSGTVRNLYLQGNNNLITYSQDFSQSLAWSNTNTTFILANTTAPDGTFTGTFLQEDATTNNHYVARGPSGSTLQIIGQPYTFSMFVKANQRNFFWLQGNGASTFVKTYFNLLTGVITSVGSGHTATINSAGGGWYRCSITFIADVSNASYYAFGLASASVTPSYTGDGVSGVYIWGAQIEQGYVASPYTLTTTNVIINTNNLYVPYSGNVIVQGASSSTSNATGAITVSGGIGVTGNVYVGYNSVMGFANSSSISASYQYYNQATNSLDTVFA
jgi:hypothetical protein